MRRRVVVKLAPAHRADVERLAARLAEPHGRVERISRRGRFLLDVDGDPTAIARALAERPEVQWAEPDEVDHAVDPGEHVDRPGDR